MVTAALGRPRATVPVIARPAMLAAAMSLSRLSRLPAPTAGAALMLVVGEVAATSLTVGAAAVQLCGTVKPPIEAARPTSAVTGVPLPPALRPVDPWAIPPAAPPVAPNLLSVVAHVANLVVPMAAV